MDSVAHGDTISNNRATDCSKFDSIWSDIIGSVRPWLPRRRRLRLRLFINRPWRRGAAPCSSWRRTGIRDTEERRRQTATSERRRRCTRDQPNSIYIFFIWVKISI
jgi:hypothetical protein